MISFHSGISKPEQRLLTTAAAAIAPGGTTPSSLHVVLKTVTENLLPITE
jgi:hypothetical protein